MLSYIAYIIYKVYHPLLIILLFRYKLEAISLKATMFSKSYKATPVSLASEGSYVVKFISVQQLSVGEYTSYIQLIGTLNSFEHTNIVKIHDVYSDDKWLVLVMDYFKGDSMFNRIVVHHEKFTETEAAHIIQKLLLALQKCHEQKPK